MIDKNTSNYLQVNEQMKEHEENSYIHYYIKYLILFMEWYL